MTTALSPRRSLAVIVALASVLACAIVLSPHAGARATNPSEVDVVGAGTLSWSRVAVLARSKAGSTRVASLKQFPIDPESTILGAYAFETGAHSMLRDCPSGGIIGAHGTPWPELLGQAVSHGCIRLDNRDVEFLRSRMPLGIPIKIVR
jgi:lipoprotein-anchoring transpeptidase ErfK/SrfK